MGARDALVLPPQEPPLRCRVSPVLTGCVHGGGEACPTIQGAIVHGTSRKVIRGAVLPIAGAGQRRLGTTGRTIDGGMSTVPGELAGAGRSNRTLTRNSRVTAEALINVAARTRRSTVSYVIGGMGMWAETATTVLQADKIADFGTRLLTRLNPGSEATTVARAELRGVVRAIVDGDRRVTVVRMNAFARM